MKQSQIWAYDKKRTQASAYKYWHNCLLNSRSINKRAHSLSVPRLQSPLNSQSSRQVRARVTKAKSKCCVKYGWDSLLGEGFIFPGTQAD